MMANNLVLVTGGSGFVGIHCVVALLNAGYRVRTTVRSLAREADIRTMLTVANVDPGDRLSFVAADLTSDANWPQAVAGCTYVLHVASPFPLHQPKNENDLIVPAREGTLRVLRAARDAHVKRVVLTSSFVAVGYGHPPTTRLFTETDWTNVNGDVSAYAKSKTLAERAGWEFVKREGNGMELAVVNPVGIFGPVYGSDLSTSIQLVQRFLKGDVPGLPNMALGMVDVRDLAAMELEAMTNPAANGERFLAVAGEPVSLPNIAALLRRRMGKAGARVPSRVLPDWLVRLLARFMPDLAEVVREFGTLRRANSAKARRVLGWTPRTIEDTITDTAKSLIALGVVKGG